MKTKINVLLGLCMLVSCDKSNEPASSQSKANFLLEEDRIGVWVDGIRTDSLIFLTGNILKRRGNYMDEDYTYRIEDSVLFITLTGHAETQHPILHFGEGSVKIDNMYASIGFSDNSGTFSKK